MSWEAPHAHHGYHAGVTAIIISATSGHVLQVRIEAEAKS